MSELPYTPDLTETGVAEVVRSLTHPSRQLFLARLDDMRLRVAGNIVSLALRRYLTENGIPHQAAPALSFAEADRYDIEIGGRRCVPVSQLVCSGDDLNKVYLPQDLGGQVYRDVDLYLFIRLDGQVNRSREEIDESQQTGEPVYRKCGLKAPCLS